VARTRSRNEISFGKRNRVRDFAAHRIFPIAFSDLIKSGLTFPPGTGSDWSGAMFVSFAAPGSR